MKKILTFLSLGFCLSIYSQEDIIDYSNIINDTLNFYYDGGIFGSNVKSVRKKLFINNKEVGLFDEFNEPVDYIYNAEKKSEIIKPIKSKEKIIEKTIENKKVKYTYLKDENRLDYWPEDNESFPIVEDDLFKLEKIEEYDALNNNLLNSKTLYYSDESSEPYIFEILSYQYNEQNLLIQETKKQYQINISQEEDFETAEVFISIAQINEEDYTNLHSLSYIRNSNNQIVSIIDTNIYYEDIWDPDSQTQKIEQINYTYNSKNYISKFSKRSTSKSLLSDESTKAKNKHLSMSFKYDKNNRMVNIEKNADRDDNYDASFKYDEQNRLSEIILTNYGKVKEKLEKREFKFTYNSKGNIKEIINKNSNSVEKTLFIYEYYK